jgi:hypothetical protein
MTTYTHQTAPTQYVEARGVRFAYRSFGKAGSVPLVFNQHFTGMSTSRPSCNRRWSSTATTT